MSIYRPAIEKIMSQLQLNVNDLSRYFGISRSHMSKILVGAQNFSRDYVYPLGQLATLAGRTKPNATIIEDLRKQSAQILQQDLLKRNKELDEQIQQLTIKLAEMSNAYSNAVNLYSTYKSMDTIAVELEPEQIAWIYEMTDYWRQVAATNDLSQQHRLKLRIELAKQERKFNQRQFV